MNSAFHVRFWGVRGSVPAPGACTVEYGGNTSCVEVRVNGQLVVLDAGTGIRLLGKTLKAANVGSQKDLTLLLTHTHWDHIQGLPFFIPNLAPGDRLRIFGREGARESLATLLVRQMESPFFPIPLRGSGAKIEIQEITDSEFTLGDIRVRSLQANHPGTCVGYRLEAPGGSLAYFPDNEPYLGKLRLAKIPPEAPQARKARASHAAMVDFLRDVDLLIMDSQYDRAEYSAHVGWGHACVDDVVSMAIEANVRRLMLFHHDPDHDDAQVSAMTMAAREQARQAGSTMRVDAAREGDTLQIGS